MPLDEDGHQDALQNRLTDDEGAIRMNRIVQDERQWISEDGRSHDQVYDIKRAPTTACAGGTLPR